MSDDLVAPPRRPVSVGTAIVAMTLSALGLVGSACATTATGTHEPPSGSSVVPTSSRPGWPGASPSSSPWPIELARRDLALRLGVAPERIEVASIDEVTWPDSCLGLPAPELCAPGPTPGYRVVFRLSGREYRYHTDKTEIFRYGGPGDAPTP